MHRNDTRHIAGCCFPAAVSHPRRRLLRPRYLAPQGEVRLLFLRRFLFSRSKVEWAVVEVNHFDPNTRLVASASTGRSSRRLPKETPAQTMSTRCPGLAS